MQLLQRARQQPGPLVLLTLAWLLLTRGVLLAHDPGLSALDIDLSDRAISGSLAIAAPDVTLIASRGASDVRAQLHDLVRDGVRVSMDGNVLSPEIDEVSIEEGAARIRMSFRTALSRGDVRRLVIASAVPTHVARGHRQLVVVKLGGRVIAERLFDEQSGQVVIDLQATAPSRAEAVERFFQLGVRHILAGYDHLAFLGGLILALRAGRELLFALTAFTVAHSVSLALVVIGGIRAPESIVEPLIALSIVWVGVENLRGGRYGTRSMVVFGVGLIHGFGFAGALIELGLGSSAAELAMSLVAFNAGVEAGQLAVGAALLPVVWTIRSRPQCQARVVPLCSLMIVLVGAYWFVERLS